VELAEPLELVELVVEAVVVVIAVVAGIPVADCGLPITIG
jgi:hypothetical protein